MSLYYDLYQLILLAPLGLTQQKRRLTGFQYSLLYLPFTNQVDDTGKLSSPVSCPKNTMLTLLILQEHLSGIFYPINHEPTISFVTPQFQTIPGGYILTVPRSNAKGMFAAGDVQAQDLYGTAEQHMYEIQRGR